MVRIKKKMRALGLGLGLGAAAAALGRCLGPAPTDAERARAARNRIVGFALRRGAVLRA